MKRINNSDSLIIYDDNGNTLLKIRADFNSDVMIMKIDGNLSADVSHDFEDELFAILTVADKIDIDLENVGYISSVSLRALLSAQQILDEKDNSRLRLINMTKEVYKTFKEQGFNELFIIR
jgi:anti-anti-sigma factor